MIKHLSYVGIIFALVILGCIDDAPRINPLDPTLNPEIQYQVSGKIEHLYSNAGINGALITLKPGFFITRSDMNGQFNISQKIEPGDYMLTVSASGFGSDSLTFTAAADTFITAKLNALPNFQETLLITRQEALFTPPNRFYLDVSAVVSDADNLGDVAAVWIEIPATGIVDTLLPISSAGEQRFFKRLRASNLGLTALDQLIGKPIVFHAIDVNSSEAISNEQFMSRIIAETPQTLRPNANVDTTDTTVPFHFTWAPALVSFPFTYEIDVFPDVLVSVPPTLQITDIPSDSTRRRYSGSELTSGEAYYWILYIIDEFGNRSQSLRTSLIIK